MPHNNRLALQSGTSMELQRGTTYVELMKTRPPVFAVRRVAKDAIDAVHVHGGSPYGRGWKNLAVGHVSSHAYCILALARTDACRLGLFW